MSAKIIPMPRRPLAATPVERAFLPAALEIVETPASPSARVTGGIICAFFAASIAWACVGKVDMVVTAPGKVVPVGQTKQVQAFETASVRRILVDDGTEVKAGQPLILLDPTLARADRDRYRDQLMRVDLDIARLNALIGPPGGADPFASIAAPAEALAAARGRYAADAAERDAKLASADREIAAKRAEAVSFEAEIAKIDAVLPLVGQRTAIRKETAEKGWGSLIEYLNAAQAQVELVNQRKVMVEKRNAAAAAVQAQIADRARIAAQTERDWRSDLQKAMHDRAETASELEKAERHTGLASVTAPIDGVVEGLAVHTEGGVVQAGQQLLRIVPARAKVAIWSVIDNKDAGFVGKGEEVEIKVDAFPYTHYGLLKGRVERVARDSEPDPESVQQTRGGTQPLGDTPANLRRASALVYVARVAIDDPTLLVDGVKTPIEPGMSVTAEIKTGRRPVIDYILSPIAQHTHDALRER